MSFIINLFFYIINNMERDSLALFVSMLSLILSIFYFLSFYAFKNSKMIKYDNEFIYLNKSKTFLCEDVNDRSTCKQPFFSNKMLSLGDNNEANDLYINKNTLICDDVDNPDTCSCLTNKCDFIKKLNHFTFIDKPTAFSSSKYGMMFGGRTLPFESSSTFSFTTWININLTDVDKWRSIFMWRRSKTEINPAILVSPRNWAGCGSKIDIRFSSLYEKNEYNIEQVGTFNIRDGYHGHCVNDISNLYYTWFHLAIVGKDDNLFYYINGNETQIEKLNINFSLGTENDDIYIGGSPEYSSEGIILSKTRWFSKPLNKSEIKNLVNESYE